MRSAWKWLAHLLGFVCQSRILLARHVDRASNSHQTEYPLGKESRENSVNRKHNSSILDRRSMTYTYNEERLWSSSTPIHKNHSPVHPLCCRGPVSSGEHSSGIVGAGVVGETVGTFSCTASADIKFCWSDTVLDSPETKVELYASDLQSRAGSTNLLLTESNRGVEKSSMRSPDNSWRWCRA